MHMSISVLAVREHVMLSVLLRIGSYSIITRVYSQMIRVHAMTNTHMKATLNNRTLYDLCTEVA